MLLSFISYFCYGYAKAVFYYYNNNNNMNMNRYLYLRNRNAQYKINKSYLCLKSYLIIASTVGGLNAN